MGTPLVCLIPLPKATCTATPKVKGQKRMPPKFTRQRAGTGVLNQSHICALPKPLIPGSYVGGPSPTVPPFLQAVRESPDPHPSATLVCCPHSQPLTQHKSHSASGSHFQRKPVPHQMFLRSQPRFCWLSCLIHSEISRLSSPRGPFPSPDGFGPFQAETEGRVLSSLVTNACLNSSPGCTLRRHALLPLATRWRPSNLVSVLVLLICRSLKLGGELEAGPLCGTPKGWSSLSPTPFLLSWRGICFWPLGNGTMWATQSRLPSLLVWLVGLRQFLIHRVAKTEANSRTLPELFCSQAAI